VLHCPNRQPLIRILSFNLEMAEFGHLHASEAHVPGAMHWLNWHGFAVTQMDASDVHERVVSAHGYSSPSIPCLMLRVPNSFSTVMLGQAILCVHVWPRWRVSASDLFHAMQIPHLLVVFHFYTPYIEAPGTATAAYTVKMRSLITSLPHHHHLQSVPPCQPIGGLRQGTFRYPCARPSRCAH
jgi:hypothetical protein